MRRSQQICRLGCLIAVILLLPCGTTAKDASDAGSQVSELLRQQKRNSDGVIAMDSKQFSTFVGGRSRPYSIIVFASALHLMDKPNLRLRELRAEFSYLSKSYRSDASTHGKVFFAEIEFVKTQEIFSRLSTKTLPYIFFVSPGLSTEGDGMLKLGARDSMQPSNYQNYPWSANDMADFVSETAGVKAAQIVRPSITNHWAFPVLVLAVLAAGGALAYKAYYWPVLQHPVIWAVGVLAIYLFSVSGGMHNIIRGVPMQHFDQRTGKMVLFVSSGQTQLGAEGFIMGTLFTSMGLSVALLTHGAPRFPEKAQRPLAFAVILIAFICYLKIKELYVWKTGYKTRWYI